MLGRARLWLPTPIPGAHRGDFEKSPRGQAPAHAVWHQSGWSSSARASRYASSTAARHSSNVGASSRPTMARRSRASDSNGFLPWLVVVWHMLRVAQPTKLQPRLCARPHHRAANAQHPAATAATGPAPLKAQHRAPVNLPRRQRGSTARTGAHGVTLMAGVAHTQPLCRHQSQPSPRHLRQATVSSVAGVADVADP